MGGKYNKKVWIEAKVVIQTFALPPIVYAMLHILVCFDGQRIYSAEIHICGISNQWPFKGIGSQTKQVRTTF